MGCYLSEMGILENSVIRDYNPDDTDQILDVWMKANALAHPFMTEEYVAKVISDIRNIYLPNTVTYVYEIDGQLVGFISLMENEIGAIFVNPDQHKQGIGRFLLKRALADHNSLEVEVFRNNSIGRAFYNKEGFFVIKEHVHEETGQDLIRMRLDTASQ